MWHPSQIIQLCNYAMQYDLALGIHSHMYPHWTRVTLPLHTALLDLGLKFNFIVFSVMVAKQLINIKVYHMKLTTATEWNNGFRSELTEVHSEIEWVGFNAQSSQSLLLTNVSVVSKSSDSYSSLYLAWNRKSSQDYNTSHNRKKSHLNNAQVLNNVKIYVF